MWAKVISSILLNVINSLASKAYQAVTKYLERRKRDKRSQEVAKKVEDAKTPSEIRDSIDDLP